MKHEQGHPSNQTECPFSPGETVESSGLYEICHRDESRTRVVLMRNDLFAPCIDCCGDTVRYKLLRAAPHVSEDSQFVETPLEPDKSLADGNLQRR
jgi:hypothetical protein